MSEPIQEELDFTELEADPEELAEVEPLDAEFPQQDPEVDPDGIEGEE